LSTVRRVIFVAQRLQRDKLTVFTSDLLDEYSVPVRWWATVLAVGQLIVWEAVMILGMGAAGMTLYGWRGALVGGMAGFLSGGKSKVRVDTFDFAFEAEWRQRPDEDSPEQTLEMLVKAAPGALSDQEWPDWMSEQVSLLANMREEDLETLRSLEGYALAQQVTNFLLSHSLPSLSQSEVARLMELPGRKLRRELKKGTLRKLLSEAELAWMKTFLARESTVPEIDEEEFLPSSDHRMRIRFLRLGLRASLRWQRWREPLRDKSYLFGDISLGGMIIILSVAIGAWVLLGGAYAAAAAVGGVVTLVAITAISKLVPRAPRRSMAANFPSPGLRATLRIGVPVALAIGLLAGLAAGLLLAWIITSLQGLRFGIVIAICAALFALGCLGGFALIQQMRIRLVLHWADLMPIRGRRFLDYATQCLFLRRPGETYIFAHRLLQEFSLHSARMTMIQTCIS
jgi:hypothetical protein